MKKNRDSRHCVGTVLVAAVSLCAAGFTFSRELWPVGTQCVGVQTQLVATQPTVHLEQAKIWARLKDKPATLEKDANLKARLMLDCQDFSFPQEIAKEWEFAFRERSLWKVIPEKQWKSSPPDVILKVEVLDYGLCQALGKNKAKVFFKWQVTGVEGKSGKTLWTLKKKKVSSSRNLKLWMSGKSDMIKGELRAHILFAVQDFMLKTRVPKKQTKRILP